jgi:hypothetical protein
MDKQRQSDFAYRSEHLMAVLGKQLAQAFYGQLPCTRTGTAARPAGAKVSDGTAVPERLQRHSRRCAGDTLGSLPGLPDLAAGDEEY